MHVPKAGGTTLHSIIDKQYKKDEIFYIKADKTHEEAFQSVEALDKEARDKLKVIKGHMPFGLHKYLSQPFTYITYLREPVKRVISNYYYLINSPDHYLFKEVAGKNMSLEDYVRSDLTNEVDNYQTRMFSGMNIDRFLFGKVPIVDCTQEDLLRAKQNLDKYFCLVGLTNQFDESLLLLKRYFGWSRVYYFKRKETDYKKNEVSQNTMEVIKSRNELDEELYTYAKDKFSSLLEIQNNGFHDDLRKFKRNNEMYGRVMKFTYNIYSSIKGE